MHSTQNSIFVQVVFFKNEPNLQFLKFSTLPEYYTYTSIVKISWTDKRSTKNWLQSKWQSFRVTVIIYGSPGISYGISLNHIVLALISPTGHWGRVSRVRDYSGCEQPPVLQNKIQQYIINYAYRGLKGYGQQSSVYITWVRRANPYTV